MVDNAKLVGAAQAYQQALARPVETSENIGAQGNSDFAGLVGEALGDAINTIKRSESVGAKTMLKQAGIDDLAIAVSNAELTLKTVTAIRDRVIGAYQDIIKMPI